LLLEKAASGETRVLISVINWGEVLYSLGKSVGLSQALSDLRALSTSVESMAADEAMAETAATVRLHYNVGYADCFAAALAIRFSATLVTADPGFAKLGKRVKVLFLGRHSGQ
jgi:ribonuclease VapC